MDPPQHGIKDIDRSRSQVLFNSFQVKVQMLHMRDVEFPVVAFSLSHGCACTPWTISSDQGAGFVEIGSFNPALHSLPETRACQIRERTATSLVLPDVMSKVSIRLPF